MKRTIAGVSVGWIGLSVVGDGVPSLLLPHQLLQAGAADATRLGLITLAALALAALAQPIAGSVSDRIGRWPVIAAGVALAGAGFVLLVTPGGLVRGALVALVGTSVAQAGHQPLVPDRIPSGWRGRAAGWKTACDVGGAFVGFLLLGALLGAGQVGFAVGALGLLLAGGFAVAVVLLRATPRISMTDGSDGTGGWSRPLGSIVAARFAFLLGIYVLGRFLVLFIAEGQHLNADDAAAQGGLVLAVLTLITVAASPPAGWLADRIGHGPMQLAGGLVAATGIALVPLAAGLGVLLGAGALVAIGSASFSSASWATMTDLTPARHAGRLLGLANWGTAGAAAAAGLAGLLIDAGERLLPGIGFTATFMLAAVASCIGGIVGWRAARVEAGPATSRAGAVA